MVDDRSDDILDNNVEEVKEKIRNAVDVDLRELLEAEREGKDRKTVKDFIESRLDSDEDSSEEVDEVVRTVEEETAGGIFGGYSPSSVFAGGLLLGLLVGLVSMGVVSEINPTGDDGVSTTEAQSTVEQLLNGSGEVSDIQERHDLYYFNVTSTVNTGNETVEQSQSFYMTKDAAIIFPTQLLGQPSYIDVEQALAQQQQQNQQPPQTSEPNSTSNSNPQ